MTDSDPLDGADIGETVTVAHTEEIWLGDLETPAASGSDRMSERYLDNVEVVTDEFGDEYLAVTVESDITKRMPHRWDYSQEPRTEAEHQQARRQKWKRRIASALPLTLATGVSFAIAMRVMSEVGDDLMINGEPIGEPSIAPVGAIVILAVVFVLAIKHLPGGSYGGRP